jgi:cytoskeletal protein RodZ
MEMSKVRNTLLVPTALLLVAGILLIVLLIRAQVVLAPMPTTYHGSSNPAPISQQTISSQGSTAPIAAPTAGTQPQPSESSPAPGSAQCPSAPGSGLPCKIP